MEHYKVLCILTDGFEELEAVGTIALLRRAGITIDVYTLDANASTGRFQITMDRIKKLSEADISEYEMLFLPGGPHYQALEKDEYVMEVLDTFMREGKDVAAICAAPTILGRRGYLKGMHYTCFTSMNEDFGGTYQDTYSVTDGHIITGKSAAAVIDFAFAIIAKVAGKDKADEVKAAIYYEGNNNTIR